MANVSFGPGLISGKFQLYQSPVAPHVYGRWDARDDDTGIQHVQILCAICKTTCKCRDICSCPAEWHTICNSGQPRSHVSRFALVHLHRDALASSRPITGSGELGTLGAVPASQSPVRHR